MIHAYIITGFLGVGKSSMLKSTVTNHFTHKRIALVVNEFGEIGVDQNILKNVHTDVIEISDGCICCTMAEEFESGVIEIINKYNPEIIFIETSGITEPFPVFMSLQNLGIAVDGVISVVDVKNYKSYIDNTTAKYQIGGANIIVLNKVDLVTPEELEIAKEEIISYKEKYDIKNTLTGKKVFNHYFFHTSEQGVVAKEVFEGSYNLEEITDLANVTHHYDFGHNSIEREASRLDSQTTFGDLEALLQALPQNIYRVKGMVKFQDVPTPLIVNYAFGNVSYDELPEYNQESLLVFIGEDIQKDIDSIAQKFKFCHFTERTNTNRHTHSHDEHNHDHDSCHH